MSIMPQDLESNKTPPRGPEPTHAVCACRVDAPARIAMCGSDCTDGPEEWSGTFCTLCVELIGTPCQFCGGV